MTMIRIEINCDGSALHDDIIGELERILGTVPAKIEQQLERSGRCICEAKEATDLLLDINGNTVGTVEINHEKVRDIDAARRGSLWDNYG